MLLDPTSVSGPALPPPPSPAAGRARMYTFRTASAADPWHFGVDPDQDPRIHASY